MRHALAEEAGVPDLIVQDGIIYAWCKHADFEAEEKFGDLRKSQGISWTELSQVELCRMEPELSSGIHLVVVHRCPIACHSYLLRARSTDCFTHSGMGTSVCPQLLKPPGALAR